MEVNEIKIMIKSWLAPWVNRVAGTKKTRPCPAGCIPCHTYNSMITTGTLTHQSTNSSCTICNKCITNSELQLSVHWRT